MGGSCKSKVLCVPDRRAGEVVSQIGKNLDKAAACREATGTCPAKAPHTGSPSPRHDAEMASPARQRRPISAPASPAHATRALMRRAAAGDGSAVIVLHQGSVEPPHGWYKSLLITAVHVPAAVSAWLFTTCVLLGLSSTCATDESTIHSARECGQPLASVQQWAPLLCSCAGGVC